MLTSIVTVDPRAIRTIVDATGNDVVLNLEMGIDTQAAIFADRLYVALAPFFQSSNLRQYSFIPNHAYFKPLDDNERDYDIQSQRLRALNRSTILVQHVMDSKNFLGRPSATSTCAKSSSSL